MTVQAKQQASGIRHYLPILSWLPHYQGKWLRADFIAGLTIMALLVPEGMAYAQLAGVPLVADSREQADPYELHIRKRIE